MRRRRANPDRWGYWLGLGGLGLLTIAAVAWKAMTPAERAKFLLISGKPNDVPIGGPWTMLDVEARGRTQATRAARANLRKGDVVAVLLNAGAPVNMPYVISVLGPSSGPLPYTGMWAIATPPAGPQMIDFGPEHVMLIT